MISTGGDGVVLVYKLPAFVVNNIRDRLVELAAEAQRRRELHLQQEQQALAIQNTHESSVDASADCAIDMEPDEYARPMTASSSLVPLPLSSQEGLSKVGSESEAPSVPPARLNKWTEKPTVSHIPAASDLASPTPVVDPIESALTDLAPPSRPTTAPHVKGKYAQVTSYELFGRKIVPGEQDPRLNKFTLELVQEGANTLRARAVSSDNKLPVKGPVPVGIRAAPTTSAAKRPSSAQAPATHSNVKKPASTSAPTNAKNANNKVSNNKASPSIPATKNTPAVIPKPDDSWIRPPPSDGDEEEDDEEGQNYDQDYFEVSDNMRLNRSQLVEDREDQDDICIYDSSSEGGDDGGGNKLRARTANTDRVEKRESGSHSKHDVKYTPGSATIYDDDPFEADDDDVSNEEGKIAELQELERSAANLESWLETLVSALLLPLYAGSTDTCYTSMCSDLTPASNTVYDRSDRKVRLTPPP